MGYTGSGDMRQQLKLTFETRELAEAYANREGFDHIVTGTGDPRGVKRLVLGSVAASIAAAADCPVTIAR